ncbi:hypothetical protein [Paenibacillus tyrfis]|uniref:Uncharacterized protein n=1 Tax=Paenibacillus tyrfis TaxID=1501230 RepID=A0A081NUH8_9BACL|nr:hypothetical protein [Paenibacillus tyrfis]KEQ22101.1 hypothetical protein ET33_27865 [Paenibacillus tyrfis]
MQEYQLTLKDKQIVWGKAIDIESLIGKYPSNSIRQGVNAALDWNLLAKEVVMELRIVTDGTAATHENIPDSPELLPSCRLPPLTISLKNKKTSP